MNNFEIIDSKGTIHSGSSEEIALTWNLMTCSLDDLCITYKSSFTKKKLRELKAEATASWEGDLKLIEVHAITR